MAVDWSGNATVAGQKRHIVIASWRAAKVTLESGFTRDEAGDWLLAAAAKNPALVVGLDFAFSFPAWWVRRQRCADVFALWRLAATDGERWLREGKPPFWGRPGQPRPRGHHAPNWLGFREADRTLEVVGSSVRPKSPFQIGGAGAVGTGSLRGMPVLLRLARGGFYVWPFQEPALPLVMEIYPRLFTGAVVKSSSAARKVYLRQSKFAALPRGVLAMAAASEDAFDALCSVLGMVERAEHLTRLVIGKGEEDRLEGAIWLGSK